MGGEWKTYKCNNKKNCSKTWRKSFSKAGKYNIKVRIWGNDQRGSDERVPDWYSSPKSISKKCGVKRVEVKKVSPDVLDISCGSCKPGESCTCKISKGRCSSGLWILRGSIFDNVIIENLPPKEVSFEPNGVGSGNALLLCFSPKPKVAKADISSQRGPFTCDDECEVGERCKCRIANCSQSYFIGLNKEEEPLEDIIFKSVGNCNNCEKGFTASNTGKVASKLFCLNPTENYREVTNIVPEEIGKAPRFGGLKVNPESNSLHSKYDKWQFNSSWTDPDDEVSDVMLIFNGEEFKYSKQELQKEGDEYYKTFESLSPGEYNYKWKAVDDGGNSNETTIQSYKIKSEEQIDSEYPKWSELNVSPSSNSVYKYGRQYQFSIKWDNNKIIKNVIFVFDNK